MRDKLKLTEELHQRLEFRDEITVDALHVIVWKNIRRGGGFRLTARGYIFLTEYLELQCYRIQVGETQLYEPKTLLTLDRKLQHPYYIDILQRGITELVLFDSKEAMLANLYGDINKFLNNYS
jgi:hypothetical protein